MVDFIADQMVGARRKIIRQGINDRERLMRARLKQKHKAKNHGTAKDISVHAKAKNKRAKHRSKLNNEKRTYFLTAVCQFWRGERETFPNP